MSFDQRRYLIPFRTALLPQIFTDVLVIGSGVAGLRAALEASRFGEVIVTTKKGVSDSSTSWAQGGVAAVLDAEDSFESHIADTIEAGAGLCDLPAVRRVVEQGPECIRELIDWGMRFDREGVGADAPLLFGREGGHHASRIVHADGDATGRELMRVPVERAKQSERVRLFDECFVLDLVTSEGANPRCIGAITHHPKYGLQMIWAGATILASGGCGQVYRESTNPPVATGDGMAMAYRAGATLADMAFMQFHPTTLYVAGASRALITEAVRGEGAYLTDRSGERFMVDIHPLAELAPRDVVSRAIIAQTRKTSFSHVYLDCRHIGRERFAERFPGIMKLLEKFEIDPGSAPIPIHPSAHYMVGGVRTDLDGRTSVPGLFAAGEVACTGLHGANRLASNSLLEGLVLGRAAGAACQDELAQAPRGPQRIVSDIRISDRIELDLADVSSSLRSVMWRHVGIEREGAQLADVSEMFDFWARYTLDKIFDERPWWEFQNMLLLGKIMVRSARWRTESRGTHCRLDHPDRNEAQRVHDLWRPSQSGPESTPVLD